MANEEMLEYVENEKRKRKEYSLAYNELNERQQVLHQQIAQQQALLHEQEKELNLNRKRIKEEQIAREKEYLSEKRERERFFEERENDLMQRQRQMEQHLHERMQETEKLSIKLKGDLAEKESLLAQAQERLEIEKQKYTEENRKQIESKSQNYVNTALTGLEAKENKFHFVSKVWSVIGAVAIVLGITFIVISTFYGANDFHNSGGFTWPYFLFITFRGLIVVAMFVALARYSFIYSNSYMHESLKSGERRHAINFGKFYLEAYGANASWEQIKEAFQHWNISSESAFSKKQSSEFDPKLMESALEISKALSKTSKDKSSETKESKE
ncbi:hypothetical protein [Grimontia marina]|uniref:Uncharacterized protein n=1 Tax=Grimontia marina TaxID=646534 RepID=A0A128F081_9GAMM|nr:hypothetical protein [Grimontia marina]CZF79646.1 hypothetical protein GMA8713_01062 [Grimontia marina]